MAGADLSMTLQPIKSERRKAQILRLYLASGEDANPHLYDPIGHAGHVYATDGWAIVKLVGSSSLATIPSWPFDPSKWDKWQPSAAPPSFTVGELATLVNGICEDSRRTMRQVTRDNTHLLPAGRIRGIDYTALNIIRLLRTAQLVAATVIYPVSAPDKSGPNMYMLAQKAIVTLMPLDTSRQDFLSNIMRQI